MADRHSGYRNRLVHHRPEYFLAYKMDVVRKSVAYLAYANNTIFVYDNFKVLAAGLDDLPSRVVRDLVKLGSC